MSAHTVRSPHAPRRQGIPANLVQKWQSSPRRATRPQVRRPKTACERCRTAKVRCYGDGHHDCDRCATRELPCRYLLQALSPGPTVTPSTSEPSGMTTPEENRAESNFSTDHAHEHAMDDVTSSQMLGSSSAWPDMDHSSTLEQQQQYMDWATVDPSATLDLSTTFQGAPTPVSQQQPSLESLGLFPFLNTTSANILSWQDQLASQSCQCRAGLAQLIPNAREALQEGRLDGVFRVTSDVVQQCESIVGCEACRVNCTDLICIMAIFQEADGCFEYVARGDIDGDIRVSMGSYQVEVRAGDNDAHEWRRLLVTQLMRRAHGLLDTISARGQSMLKKLDPGCKLGRVNIEYLEAVIRNSKENLNHSLEGLDVGRTAEQRL